MLGRDALKRAVASELDAARACDGVAAYEHLALGVIDRLDRDAAASLVAVINATGVLLHTNLGRAPLAEAACAHACDIGRGYSNLEYDLTLGERGSRYDRVTGLLREITGAQDALVVNNCAAAMLLILDTFAKGREVVVARNQLIEIGGGFRVPEVLERSGAILVEVGTTNKVNERDFERALTTDTALLLRTHQSNFAIEGFTADAAPPALSALARRAGIPLVEDLGSGAVVDLAEYGLPHERTVQDALRDGVDVVAFSGDKLLGGPQAGIIVGNSALTARLRANPLLRALRVDKMTLALLAATLRLYHDRRSREQIPFFAMLAMPMESLRERARRYAAQVGNARIVDAQAFVGGGSLPRAHVPSVAIAFETPYPDQLMERLRRGRPPIVARIENGEVRLDLRTIAPKQDAAVIEAVLGIAG